MGQKDEYYYDYLDDDTRFADQVNGALFQGKQVVKSGELEPADAQTLYLGREAGARKNVRAIADKVRMWKGSVIHILVVEHQSYVDHRMVLRNMLAVVANVKITEECKVVKDGEERFEMCKAFEDYRLEGKTEGMQEQLVIQVCKKPQKNKSVEEISEELELELVEAEKIVAAQKEVGSYDVEAIRKALTY